MLIRKLCGIVVPPTTRILSLRSLSSSSSSKTSVIIFASQPLITHTRHSLSQAGWHRGNFRNHMDYSISTSDRYRSKEEVFTGPYKFVRARLDYSWHTHFVAERQHVQDGIITRCLENGGGGAAVGSAVASKAGGENKTAVSTSSTAAVTSSVVVTAAAVVDTINNTSSSSTSSSSSSSPSSSSSSLSPSPTPSPPPPSRERPWLVYTAGPMGAGKSHTLRCLYKQGLFPLDQFTWVDCDRIKTMLPDTPGYIQQNRSKTGVHTHAESTFLAEIIELEALRRGYNIIVDGTLRNSEWYAKRFGRVRAEFPQYRIAIIMVTASKEKVYERAAKRALVTAREVPKAVLDEALEQVPKSFAALAPLADYTAVFDNDDNSLPPQLQPPETLKRFAGTFMEIGRGGGGGKEREGGGEKGALDPSLLRTESDLYLQFFRDQNKSNTTTTSTNNNDNSNSIDVGVGAIQQPQPKGAGATS